MRVRDFKCADCGDDVFAYAEPDGDERNLCRVCEWISRMDMPEERERLRALFSALNPGESP